MDSDRLPSFRFISVSETERRSSSGRLAEEIAGTEGRTGSEETKGVKPANRAACVSSEKEFLGKTVAGTSEEGAVGVCGRKKGSGEAETETLPGAGKPERPDA
ncbi:MAG: hypothetical protein HGB34_02100 [Candidatus Moranbacteria bacterium]|nr:hypothetical protein [Candidatus Moranbacteria bacterium]